MGQWVIKINVKCIEIIHYDPCEPLVHLVIDTVRKCMSHESQCRMQQDCSARRIVSRKYSIQHWIKFCSNFLTNWSLNIPRCDASHSLSSLLPLPEPGGFSEGGEAVTGGGVMPLEIRVYPAGPHWRKAKQRGIFLDTFHRVINI